VAGLLHDVGKAVIAQLYPRCMHDVVETIQSEGVSAYEAERKVLGGVGHTEIGGWLAERWGLPPHLVASVSHHHHPQDAGAQRPMAAAIRIADSVSRECGAISTSSDEPQPEPLTLSELPGFADAPLGRMREQLGHAGGLISAVAAGALY
jgi:HD-like signal output (HDOD) protein